MKPKVPIYDAVNIKIRGYDFPVLEEYQQLTHKVAKSLDIDIEDAWGLPSQNWDVKTYKPNTEVTQNNFKLHLFQRVVQVVDLSAGQVRELQSETTEASYGVGFSCRFCCKRWNRAFRPE